MPIFIYNIPKGLTMLVSDYIYEDGIYWIVKPQDKRGFMICRNNGVCGDVVGFASTFKQAKESIKLQCIIREEDTYGKSTKN